MRWGRWIVMLVAASGIGGGLYVANQPKDPPKEAQSPVSVDSGQPAQPEDPAILEAKEKESGELLVNGDSVEVKTDSGVVIVRKDEAGNVTYTKK